MAQYTRITAAYATASTSAAFTGGKRRTCQATTTRATRRSASFQAATTSSAVPRTPRSQSCAIAALWSTSPTTSTPIAAPVKRRALIDDRHQREPQIHDANPAGEQSLEAGAREQVDLGRELPSGRPIHTVRHRVREIGRAHV